MAQKLHSTYNFSYNNLKVLLGGWNTWKQQNATDPKGYPVAVAPGTTPGAAGSGGAVVTSTIQLQPAPANTP